jgi:sodium-dependent dicarboxylate transporter 2/3/5
VTTQTARTPLGGALRLLGGGALAVVVYLLLGSSGLTEEGRRVAALAVCIATWWVTEALPLEATGLAPIALFPLFGVGTITETAAPYATPVIFLFLGGMILGQGMERWGLHRRMALWGLSKAGAHPVRIIGAMVVMTAFLSMWVSNTAAAVMMVPIAGSIAGIFARAQPGGGEGSTPSPLGASLILAVAYGASIGGVGTLIGTPPTAQFAAFMQRTMDRPVRFLEWLQFGLIIVPVMCVAVWGVLAFTSRSARASLAAGEEVRAEIIRQHRALGPWSPGERAALGAFIGAAVGWLLAPILARAESLKGTLVGDVAGRLSDATIAVIAALALFVIPVGTKPYRPALTWAEAERVPWGVLILAGGGLSLAAAINRHGVDVAIAQAAAPLTQAHVLLVLFVFALGAVMLTEVTSNTALVAAALPVAFAVGQSMDAPPVVLLVTVTLAASLGFMMPSATPPNAIVYATRRVTMRQMIRAGILLDLLVAAIVPLIVYGAWKLGILPGV